MQHEQSELAEDRIVANTLTDADCVETQAILVGDALVIREGSHHWIEIGGDRLEDLRLDGEISYGRCDCGDPLDSEGHCKTCGKSYRV